MTSQVLGLGLVGQGLGLGLAGHGLGLGLVGHVLDSITATDTFSVVLITVIHLHPRGRKNVVIMMSVIIPCYFQRK